MARFGPEGGFARLLLLSVLLSLYGCQYSPPVGTSEQHAASRSAPGGPSHDLSADEEMGGHTLRKHVGRTDEQLRARLEQEPGISAASTYTDRAAAEMAVGTVLEQARGRIERWLERRGRAPNLVLDYRGERPIGRTLHRGDSASLPCSDAKVVLRMSRSGQYYVLTSYPECR